MNIQELRVGNWVIQNQTQYSPEEYHQLTLGDFYDAFEGSLDTERDFSPIPLTAQWLDRFGFGVSLESNFGAVETSYCYALENDGSIFELSEDFYFRAYDKADTGKPKTPMIQVKVETVHHLQNLFFALTGQELNAKEI